MSEEKPKADEGVPVDDNVPPVGGSWRNLYAAVIGTLVLLVILFYAFTRAFA